MWRFLLY
ncbi:hypothetical protein CGLO_12565 [Colletotrichum gloeosporioides Cg-14]|nr:hypothetical protein CGLO_12565 [Colletotrichum gloeosporioides Cg-14]